LWWLLAILLLLHAPGSLLLLRHSIPLRRLLLLLTVALHRLCISLSWLLPVALGLHRLPIALHRLLPVALSWLLLSVALDGLLSVGLSLHWLLAVSLRLLAVGLGLRLHTPTCLLLSWHAITLHRLLLAVAAVTLWLLTWSWQLAWLLLRSRRDSLWLLSRDWLSWLRCLDLLKKVVLLQVASELIVVDALLQTDKSIVELDIELGALLQQHLQVVSNHDRFVDLLEKLALGRVIAH